MDVFQTSGRKDIARLEAFKHFAPACKQAGVQQTEAFQPGDDPNYIVVSLRSESADAANNFR